MHSWTKRSLMSFLALLSVPAVAAEYSNQFNLPAAAYFSSVNPIVYPSAAAAPLSDPATLPYFGKSSELEVANAPVMSGGGYGVFAGATRVGRTFGVGAGYLGDVGATLNHGFYAGAGANLGLVSIGVDAVKAPVVGTSTQFDASLAVQTEHYLRFAAEVTQLQGSPQVGIGAGAKGEHVAFELDVKLPPMNHLDQGYQFSSAATLAFRRAGVFGAISYLSTDKTVAYTAGASYQVTALNSLILQYGTNQRLVMAMTVAL